VKYLAIIGIDVNLAGRMEEDMPQRDSPPCISVVVPTCKRSNYLKIALHSVCEQTLQPTEIIVCEDGVDERTRSVIQEFRNVGYPVHHESNDPPLRQLKNRQKAMKLAKCDFIAMLDDDDLWEPTFLEKTYTALVLHPNCDFCSTDQYLVNEFGEKLHEETEVASEMFGRKAMPTGAVTDVLFRELKTKPFPLQATLFRRSALEKVGFFPEYSGTVPDFALVAALGANGSQAYYICERLGGYRVHTGQQTNSRVDNGESVVRFLRQFSEERRFLKREERVLSELYRSSIMELAIGYARETNLTNAVQTLVKYFDLGLGLPRWRRLIVLGALFMGIRPFRR
jgi:glycosyltransferase involved in cell wall biosynthesis